MHPHHPPHGQGHPPLGTEQRRGGVTVGRVLVPLAVLVAVAAMIGGLVLWLGPGSPSPAVASGEQQEQTQPSLDLPPDALTRSVAAMPTMPDIVWRATPESLGLGDGLQFNPGHRGQEDGAVVLPGLVVTKYSSLTNLRPNVLEIFADPEANRVVAGLVGIDTVTGRARWSLEVDSVHTCFHVELTTSAVCQIGGPRPSDWPHPEEYLAYDIIDLESGTITGRTAFAGSLEEIRETNGRVISFSKLIGGDAVELASGTLADPREDWVTRIDRRAEDATGTGGLDRLDAVTDAATGCRNPEWVEDGVIGSAAVVGDGTSLIVDLTRGTPVDIPPAIRTEVPSGGAVIASGVCAEGWGESLQTDELEWIYHRLDGVPLPGIDGTPVLGFQSPVRSLVTDLPASELPVFTTTGAYSVDGQQLWTWPEDSRVFGLEAVAVVGDTVVVSGQATVDMGRMRGYDLATGTELWRADPPLNSNGGRAYFVGTDGERVFSTTGAAVSLRTGATEWDLDEFPEPPPMPDVFAKFGASTAYTQWGDGVVVHTNEREIIGYR